MRRDALAVLACPHCHGPLTAAEATPTLDSGSLTCPADDLRFPIVDGIPELLHPDRREVVRAFVSGYADAWRRDGWEAPTPETLLALPYRDPSGGRSATWRVKARSMEAVLPLVERMSGGRVVDLGAGTGWLAHHLALRRLEVYAVDVMTDPHVGLGAASVYLRDGLYFERVCGEALHPPFRDDSFDAVICNASLHYVVARDAALAEIRRILKPGGSLVVMNSPVQRDPASASRAAAHFRDHLRSLGATEPAVAGYHHFVRDEFVRALGRYVGPVVECPYDPGRAFRWIRRAKGIALGMELASFPILVARKQLHGTPGALGGEATGASARVGQSA